MNSCGIAGPKMSENQGDDAEYMAEEYEMEDVDDEMDDEFRGREMGGSESDVDEYDLSVCVYGDMLCYFTCA